MATHYSILVLENPRKWQPTIAFLSWRIPWTEPSGGLWSRGRKETDTTVHSHTHNISGTTLREEDSSKEKERKWRKKKSK